MEFGDWSPLKFDGFSDQRKFIAWDRTTNLDMNVNTKRGPVVLVDQAPCVIRPHIPTGERAVQSKFLHLLRDFSQ